MNVIPQINGSLRIHDPVEETVYDLGNARLYGRCDAQGRIISASVPEGFPLQTIRAARYFVLDDTIAVDAESVESVATSLADQFKGTNSEGAGKKQKKMWAAVNSQPIVFDTAEALGRIWQLSGHQADLSVTVTTFVDGSTPAIFQRVQITNNGLKTKIFALDLTVSMQFEKGYVGSSHSGSGHVNAQIHFDTSFGATLRPWQLVMDKTHNVLSYVLPVDPNQMQEFCLITAAVDDLTLEHLLQHWPESYAHANAYTKN